MIRPNNGGICIHSTISVAWLVGPGDRGLQSTIYIPLRMSTGTRLRWKLIHATQRWQPSRAAFDERIGAVVPSRGNFAGAIPFRYATAMFGNERIDQVTRYYPQWFSPRFRFFIGREHKLPVDQNSLLSLIAPAGAPDFTGLHGAPRQSVGCRTDLSFGEGCLSLLGQRRPDSPLSATG